MPKKITDITQKVEDPQVKEVIANPEQFKEMPGGFEVEKRPEAVPAPEILQPEKPIEQVLPQGMAIPTALPSKAPLKSPVLEKIENVLQEDLEDIYFQLPPDKQVEFRQVGEETASKIALLLGGVKVQVKKILELIIKWLRIIPHVNKYFLEQEAKIKTDRLLELKGDLPDQDKNKI